LTVATIFAFVFSFLAVFPPKIVANAAIMFLLELLFCGVFPCRVFRGLRCSETAVGKKEEEEELCVCRLCFDDEE
jgi:hypothetical protein